MVYLFTVSTTRLLLGISSPNLHIRKLNEASPGIQLLASIVSRANNGAPTHHVLPAIIASADNTTIFVFRGARTELEGWYLIESNNKGIK